MGAEIGAVCGLAAQRSAFDSNGDGKLNASYAGFAKFKLLVTKADGTTKMKTLGELNITEIDPMGDAAHIKLPDGSPMNYSTSMLNCGLRAKQRGTCNETGPNPD